MNEILELKRIAFRSLARHKMKTFLTCAAIMVSTALYIWMQSWIGGMTSESRRNIVNYETGAAKLQTKLYFKNKDELPSYENFKGRENYAAALENAGYYSAPRYTFSGTIYSPLASAPIVIHAVDPDSERRVLLYPDYTDLGRFISPGEFAVALGEMTAEKIKVGVPTRISDGELTELINETARGEEEAVFMRSCYVRAESKTRIKDRYVLRRDITKEDSARLWNIFDDAGRNNVRVSTVIDYKTESGAIRHVNQVIDAKVAGFINSPNPATNFNTGYMPLDIMDGEEGMMLEGAVTEILIRSKKSARGGGLTGKDESKEAVLAALGGTLDDSLDVYTWQECSADYLGYEKTESGITKIFSYLLFFLALIGISNTMLLAILERTKEIGMMRALGMTHAQITGAYFLEALMLGFFGSLLGVIAGCALNYPMVTRGFDFSEMLEQLGGSMGYRVSGNFRGMWDIPVIILTPLIATALSGLMAIPPARRALKAEIAESLRFE